MRCNSVVKYTTGIQRHVLYIHCIQKEKKNVKKKSFLQKEKKICNLLQTMFVPQIKIFFPGTVLEVLILDKHIFF